MDNVYYMYLTSKMIEYYVNHRFGHYTFDLIIITTQTVSNTLNNVYLANPSSQLKAVTNLTIRNFG